MNTNKYRPMTESSGYSVPPAGGQVFNPASASFWRAGFQSFNP